MFAAMGLKIVRPWQKALVERLGRDVFVIPGERRNLKITTPEDMKIAEALIED
jgi:2-C-methyl-D-erythritol 4-phosphate cytidylyltransferase